MATIDHVTLRVSSLADALALYTQVFERLGFRGERYDGELGHEWKDFSISQADPAHSATRGLRIALAAASHVLADEWWGSLDGNSIEAVHHETGNLEAGGIDHVWIRVADLTAAKSFYGPLAAAVGLESRDLGDRLELVTDSGMCTLTAGPPTRNLHLAFGVGDREAVRDFHRAGLDAGGRDNGLPGERPQYHPGYYGAFLLDPDSNNIEAVFHDRP